MAAKIKILFVTIFYALLAGSIFLSGCVEKTTTGSTYFSSVPSGAEIWIDGLNMEKVTPATIPYLKEGNHTYSLKKEGYVSYNGNFYIEAGQTTTVPVAILIQTQVPMPTSTRISEASPTELKYHLIKNFGEIFYCDPDFSPIPVTSSEVRRRALGQFSDIHNDTEEFQAILRHTNLEGITNFSIEQKIIIYRENKKLNNIFLEPSGAAYKFQSKFRTENGTVFQIEGIIYPDKTITILKKEPGIGSCPICLSGNTVIDTPAGPVVIKDLQKGMAVWTTDARGARVPAVIIKNVSVPAPTGFRITHLVLDDRRELFASPGHPTADGRALGAISTGDVLDGAGVVIAEQIPYEGTVTYDILPSGNTGFYWANGILIGSTLKNYSYSQNLI